MYIMYVRKICQDVPFKLINENPIDPIDLLYNLVSWYKEGRKNLPADFVLILVLLNQNKVGHPLFYRKTYYRSDG